MLFPRPELLLHDLIPPPLHGLAPRTVKGNTWWDVQRKSAMAKNMWKCWACNIPKTKAKKHKWLEGHESYDIDWKKGTCTLTEIVSLCHYCHNYIHLGRLQAMVEYGRESKEFMQDVVTHGNNLTAHLKKPKQPSPVDMAPWGQWVLIIDGVPYPSRFTSVEQWSGYYHWINTTGVKDDAANLAQFCKLAQ
jgi:hypothetical protein